MRPGRGGGEQAQQQDPPADPAAARPHRLQDRQEQEAGIDRQQEQQRVAARLGGVIEHAVRAGEQQRHGEPALVRHDARGIEQRREAGEDRGDQARGADRALVRIGHQMAPEIEIEVVERRIRLGRPDLEGDIGEGMRRLGEIERGELVDPEILPPERRRREAEGEHQDEERRRQDEPLQPGLARGCPRRCRHRCVLHVPAMDGCFLVESRSTPHSLWASGAPAR